MITCSGVPVIKRVVVRLEIIYGSRLKVDTDGLENTLLIEKFCNWLNISQSGGCLVCCQYRSRTLPETTDNHWLPGTCVTGSSQLNTACCSCSMLQHAADTDGVHIIH